MEHALDSDSNQERPAANVEPQNPVTPTCMAEMHASTTVAGTHSSTPTTTTTSFSATTTPVMSPTTTQAGPVQIPVSTGQATNQHPAGQLHTPASTAQTTAQASAPPPRTGGRTSPGSHEARPFTVRGVPTACFNSVQIVSKSTLEAEIRDLARSRSENLATAEEEESYILRLLQTTEYCAKVVLLPLKREMQDAAGDINFNNRREIIKDKLFRAICDGPYLSQLRGMMKTVTTKTGETPELQGMEDKIKAAMEDNVTLINDMISNGNFWEEPYTAQMVEELFHFHLLPATKGIIKNLFYSTLGMETDSCSYLLQPTTDSNAHEISSMKKDILTLMQEREERKALEEKLVESIAGLKQDATAADFEREEVKLRVDAQDRDKWGKASNEQRQNMIKEIITACFMNDSFTRRVHIWITKPGRGSFLPWARVTFPNTESKYAFEKFVKQQKLEHLSRQEKYFTTQRLVPQSFIPTKNEMLLQGKHKLAQDWENLVSSQADISKKQWVYAKEATWRHMNVRIQFKMTPRFGVWIEGLDPCHRLCWRAIDLEDCDSFFKDYDLSHRIPDPTTRTKALEDPAFSTPRKPFRDEESLEIKNKRPNSTFKTRAEQQASRKNKPKRTTGTPAGPGSPLLRSVNTPPHPNEPNPRQLPPAAPLLPVLAPKTVTGARPKNSSVPQGDLQTDDTVEVLLVESTVENNTGVNLTDDSEFPQLQRRNSGRTPRGENINALIEQLNTCFDDRGNKIVTKNPTQTGEGSDTATLQVNPPDNKTTAQSPSNRSLDQSTDNPVHEDAAGDSSQAQEGNAKEKPAREVDTGQEASASEIELTKGDQDSPNANEASDSGSTTNLSATAGQGTNTPPTPAVQQDTEESRKVQEESMQEEALATPFKDGAEELDEDPELSEEEMDTPEKEHTEVNSVPASASKQGHAALFSMGKTPKLRPKRSGMRQPVNYEKKRTPKKKK